MAGLLIFLRKFKFWCILLFVCEIYNMFHKILPIFQKVEIEYFVIQPCIEAHKEHLKSYLPLTETDGEDDSDDDDEMSPERLLEEISE